MLIQDKGEIILDLGFAWCNSEFGKTILHLAKNKPHLIFKRMAKCAV